jgi:hypothetical protein
LTVAVIDAPALTEGLVPKPFPLIVTLSVVPTAPFEGVMLLIVGMTLSPH